MTENPFLRICVAWIGAALLAGPLQAPAGAPARAGAQASSAVRKAAAEWVEVERVVDGDTIHVHRQGRIEKLRLLSVDTEERLGKGHASSATKPQTVFGEECALWAQKLFADVGREGAPARIGLLFPGDVEKRDVYGRLLCHVLLPDGTDYNLMLVRVGRSPYFNKYGNDLIDPAAFVAAQRTAREARLGIWNPATNEPRTPGAPAVKRPYPELLAWWNARALAVEGYRGRAAAEPEKVADSEDPDSLERAVRSEREIDVFGEVEGVFDEATGDRTLLMRATDKEKAVRIRISSALREAHAALDLGSLGREFRQNYVWVHGRLERGRRGFEMRSDGPDRWHRAGPEPGLPPPRSSK